MMKVKYKKVFKLTLLLGVLANVSYTYAAEQYVDDYNSLIAAISGAQDGDIIILNNSIEVTGALSSINKNITIDGQGLYGIYSSSLGGFTVSAGKNVTFKNIGQATVNLETGEVTYVEHSGLQGFHKSYTAALRNNGTLTLDNVVFYGNDGANGHGRAMYNSSSGTILSIKGKFLNNTNGSGTLANYGNIAYVKADFVGNSGGQHGGAILNNKGAKIQEIRDSNFIANSSARSGGAIRNLDGANEVTIYDSLFRFNNSRQGGAIKNSDESKAIIYNSLFDRNYAIYDSPDSPAASRPGGGAISNTDGKVYITDSQFTNNAAENNGGAILSDGLLYIYAKEKDVEFKNNKSLATISNAGANATVSGGVYNDLYLLKNAEINANAGKNIIFNGSVVNAVNTVVLSLNNDASIQGGNYIFNNEVTNGIFNIYNGAAVKFGTYNQVDGSVSYGKLNGVSFSNDTKGGTIDFQNNHIDDQVLTDLTLNSDIDIKLDVDLVNGISDYFSANTYTGNGKLNIVGINILSDNPIDLATKVSNSVLKDAITLSIATVDGPSLSYSILYDTSQNDGGYLRFSSGEMTNLVIVNRAEAKHRFYSLGSDENIAADIAEIGDGSTSIGEMGGVTGTIFTINGNSDYSINGENYAEITVKSGKTLNVDNVGSLEANGDVKAAWQGFKGTLFSVSSGTLNFTGDNVIANNTAIDKESLISNNGGTITVSDGSLNILNNSYHASLINNTNGTIGDFNTLIKSNLVNTGTGSLYGLIYNNAGSGKTAKIGELSGEISNNVITNSNGNLYGGIIYNYSKGTAEIDKITALFQGNQISTSALYGGLIRNQAEGGAVKIGDITGDIKENTLAFKNDTYGAIISNKATTKNAEIGNISGNITNNTINMSGNKSLYGIIQNEGNSGGTAKILGISGDISNNSINGNNNNSLLGGMIYNCAKSANAEIGEISGDIKNNSFKMGSMEGSIISNKNTSGYDAIIDAISGNIEENMIIVTNTIDGGIIYNQSQINSISGKIINNYIESKNATLNGGVLFNDASGNILMTSDIENNYVKGADITNSDGGIIYNSGTLTLSDVSLKDNATNLENTISNSGNLSIIANNKDVVFAGNKVGATITRNETTGEVSVTGGDALDIRNSGSSVLNLFAKTGKSIIFEGAITDDDNQATANIGGTYDDNGTEKNYEGSVIFKNTVALSTLNIKNNANIILGVNGTQFGLLNLGTLTNDAKNGSINSINNHIENHQITKATLNSALNIGIDMSVATDLTTEADTFTLGADSTGTFNIADLNMLGDGIAAFKASTESKEIIQKILNNANSNTILTLSNTVKSAYEEEIADELVEDVDEITGSTVKYNEKYGEYELTRQRALEVSIVGSSQGLADAIRWAITVTDSDKIYKDDTLHLINIASGTNRVFDFDGTTNTFNVTENTGTTAVGKLTILGTQNGTAYSTIDADGHSLFDITTSGAAVDIQNTKIKNAEYIADVTSGNVLTLSNVIIDNTNTKGITGTGTTVISGGKTVLSAESNQNLLTINSNGELENNAKFTLADKISNSGTLTSIADNIVTENGIENEGVINFIGGENLNNISGTNGTVNFSDTSINSGTIEQKIITNSNSLTSDAGTLKASAGIQNTGNLYLTGGITQSIISGENGTIHTMGSVTIGKAINNNVLSLDSGSTKLGITDLSTAQKLVINGGDLNLQYLSSTEDYNLGNVEILEDMGLGIDVDLTGNTAIKKVDTISATTVSGSKKIYINNLNITVPSPGDEAPTYSKVADNNLKDSVDLGDNAKTHVNNISQNGFMITYEKDTEGENTGGFLHLTYADLVTAARATTRSRIYVMGSADEDVVSQLDEQGGTGITDNNHLFGGVSLSVNGTGIQSIIGSGTTGGIQLAGTQTLSLNNIKEYTGFSTGITNYGTVNVTNVDFIGNTIDINNNTVLNLYGTDELKTITGDTGTINIASYVDGDNQTINAEVTFATDGNITQKDIVIAENNVLENNANLTILNKISNNGTITSKANNISTTNGIINNGILNLTGGENTNAITGTDGVIYLTNTGSNSASITQNSIINSGTYTNNGTINGLFDNSNATLENNSEISLITMDGGNLNNGTNGTILATDLISGNVINAGSINNTGRMIIESSDTYTNTGYIANSGDLTIKGTKEIGQITGLGDSTTGNIVLGDTSTDISTVNKDIAQQTITLNNGTLKFAATGSLTDNVAFIGNNGTLDTQNSTINTISLGAVTLNSNIMWAIDADLANMTADNVTGNANPSGSGKLVINAINLLSDGNYKYIETKVADNNLKGIIALASDQFIVNNLAGNGSYLVTYQAKTDGGYLTFDNSDMNNLVIAARKEGSVVYSMSQNESIETDLAAIPDDITNAIGNQIADDYTINGNGHSIDGANKGGIITSATQVLTLNNISEVKDFSGNAITNAGTLNINAQTTDTVFNSTAGIKNTGDLILNAAEGQKITIAGAITDDTVTKGVTTVKGDGITNINNSITQDKLLIESGTVNVSASNLNIDEFIQNDSILNLDEGILSSIIKGNNGTTNIVGEVTNNASITQNEITIEETAKLTTNASDITSVSGIDNNGTLEWIGSGENNNIILSSNNEGIIEVKGTVQNNQSVTQNKIIIAGNNAELISNADNLSTIEGIENNSLLTLTGGQNTNKIDGTGKLVIKTDNQVENEALIKQKQITVEEGTLISDVANLVTTENIKVSDLLRLTGTGDNTNRIIGNGTTEIAGTLTTSNTISSNLAISGTLTTSADKLDIASKSLKGAGGTLDLSVNDKYAEVLTVKELDLNEGNLNLIIDVDLANKQADQLNVTSISGSNKLVINGFNLISDAQENLPITTTVLTVNDTSEAEKLSQNVELQGAPVTIQGEIPEYSYLVSYIVKDLTGNLQFEYANLATAIIFDAEQKVYTMANEESLSEEKEMQGKNLSICGNGNAITGDGTNNGIRIGNDQTLSINDVNSMQEFDQAIVNDGGTVNLKNVSFTNNTVDVNNNSILNLEGNNVLQDGIIGDNGKTNIISGETTLSGETTQETITVSDATLNNQGIISAAINNAGTINNENELKMNGTSVNTGKISGNGTLTVNGTLENTEDTASIVQDKVQITENGELTSDNDKISAYIVNDGIFNMSGAENNNIVDGTGIVNINSSMRLNEQIGGTNTINVNEGVLTFADNEALGSNVKLNANKGSSIDVENNQMSVDQVVFKEGSTLKLKVNSLSDFGSIIANTINVEQGANLFAVLGQGLIEVGQEGRIQLLTANNSDFNNFSDSFENNMYRFEKDGKNGAYIISQARTAEDVLKEANANKDIVGAGHAWIDGSQFPDENSQEVADKLTELAQTDAHKLIKALKGLAPNDAPIVKTLAIERASYLSDMLQNHIYNRSEEQSAQGLSSNISALDASVWIKTYAARSTIAADDNAGGFNINRQGAVLGIDKKVNSDTLVGMGYGADTTKAKSHDHNDKVQTHSLFAYTRYKPNDWYMESLAAYSQSQYNETKQSVSTIRAKYDVKDLFFKVDNGYEFNIKDAIITPELSLRYHYIKRDGYKDSAGQKVDANNLQVFTPVVGVKASTEFEIDENKLSRKATVRPEVYVGAGYDVKSDNENSFVSLPNGESYVYHGNQLDKFFIETKAGVKASFTDDVDVGLWYLGNYRGNYQSHAGMVELKVRF